MRIRKMKRPKTETTKEQIIKEQKTKEKQTKEKQSKEQKSIGFPRLALESIPELWAVRALSVVIVGLLVFGMEKLFSALLGFKVLALTSANLKSFFLSWQAPVVIIIAVAVSLIVIALDLFIQIQISGAILRGERVEFFSALKQAVLNIRRFLNPAGLSLLVYVLFGVPLSGIGFSVRLTADFKLPNFIMGVIMRRPLFMLLYLGGCAALVVFGILNIFSFHGILLTGKTTKEAKKYSVQLLKKNWKQLLLRMVLVLLATFAIRLVTGMIVDEVIPSSLEKQEQRLPEESREFSLEDMIEGGFVNITEEQLEILGYRVNCATAVLMGGFVKNVISILLSAFVMLYFTRLFLIFHRAECGEGTGILVRRRKNGLYLAEFLSLIGTFAGVFLLSLVVANSYIFMETSSEVPLVAHRAGGDLASENSAEGVTAAIEHGCFGTETDIQRTKDGYYIINHDDTFKRMAGVNKSSQQMTLEEIKALKIKDTTGNGKYTTIPTLEEFLDRGGDQIYFLLELKGATADRRMADDVVRIVKERGLENQASIISLKYDLIDYVETTYPEMNTGVLFFLGTGDLTKLHTDAYIVEEGMASDGLYQLLHNAGKQVMVWTVNSYYGLYDFLDDDVDGVVTDDIEMAERVREDLANRTDMQMIDDRLWDAWN